MKITELKQKRAGLVKQARDILDIAEKRGEPGLTAEDKSKYDLILKDVDSLAKDIAREEELRELERVDIETRKSYDKNPKTPDKGGADKEKRGMFYNDVDKADIAFRNFLISGEKEELRALAADPDTAGGYIVAPQQFMNTFIKEKDDLTFFRRLAKKFSVKKAASLGMPSLDNDPVDPTWTSELKTGNEDNAMSFGKRELFPHPLAQRILVSEKLLRSSILGAEQLVRERLAYKISIVEENAFLNGSGSGQPLGIFTASTNGISTDRDVSDGNTATQIRTDNLINVKMSLKKQYRGNVSWIFHRDTISQLMKLKDGTGRYIWEASITVGQPDRLLNYNINESEYAPNTFTTGKYVGILGDYNFYYIAEALTMRIQKLVELHALTNQIGFISRSEIDGMPILQNAFARVKLG